MFKIVMVQAALLVRAVSHLNLKRPGPVLFLFFIVLFYFVLCLKVRPALRRVWFCGEGVRKEELAFTK